MSSRPDVASPSYTRELEKLQDQIPPFPNSDAMAVIEEDTGQPIVSLFSYISPEPIAAASLGQVREHLTELHRTEVPQFLWDIVYCDSRVNSGPLLA